MSGSRVLILVAAIIGVVSVAVVGWRAVERPPAALQRASAPESPPQITQPIVDPAPAAPASQVAAAPSPPEPAPEPAAPAPAPVVRPTFDIVRVEPSGDTVIAGRGAPKSHVVLSQGPRVLAETDSDAQGEFVLIPPAFRPGDHLLNLRIGSGAQEALASLTISVPGKASEPALATVSEADQPTRVLTRDDAKAQLPPGSVAVRTVEAGEEGAFFASGVGPPGATVRLYLNDAFVADVRTAADGSWTLRVERGMSPGHYEVRADLVEEGGKVTARAQTPFDYPRQESGKAAPTEEPAPAPAAAPTPSAPGVAVVAEIQSVKVVRGDSLWRISQRVLGQGRRYTQIYEVNTAQIRDPDRIVPGQVLVTPRQ